MPLVIIAEDAEVKALAVLVVNQIRGTMQCCAVKVLGYGVRRKSLHEAVNQLAFNAGLQGAAIIEHLKKGKINY